MHIKFYLCTFCAHFINYLIEHILCTYYFLKKFVHIKIFCAHMMS